MKRYHWRVLPQEMKNSPTICQLYVTKILSPAHTRVGECVILRYTDDVPVCSPDDNVLNSVLEDTITALTAVGFELQEKSAEAATLEVFRP